MTELERLIAAFETAQQKYNECRESKFIYAGFGDSRALYAQAESAAKFAAADLAQAKDNLCNYLLKHRDFVKVEAVKLWNVYGIFVDMVIRAETKDQALEIVTARLRELDSDHPALKWIDDWICEEITPDGEPGIVTESK